MNKPLSIISVVGILAIAACATVIWITPSSWEAPQARLPEIGDIELDAGSQSTEPGLVSEDYSMRPLFLPSRRPPVVQSPAQEAPATVRSTFPEADMVGVFGTASTAGVIIRHKGVTAKLLVGESWSGWRLDWADPQQRSAMFESADGIRHPIKLKRQPQLGGMTPAQRSGREAQDQNAVEGVGSEQRRQIDARTADSLATPDGSVVQQTDGPR